MEMARTASKDSLERQFAQLLVESGVFLTGSFQLKSGKMSDYFLDFGRVPHRSLAQLGRCYATRIGEALGADGFDLIYGPAFKGIPIALFTTTAFNELYGTDKGCAFDRKAPKDHGEIGRASCRERV